MGERPGGNISDPSDYDGEERDFVVEFWADDEDRAAGIENVTVGIEHGNPCAEVTDDNGNVIECGHQRPPEVSEKWDRAARKSENRAIP